MSPDDLDALANKLKAVADRSDVMLTKDERQAVREMLIAWEVWKSFGRVGKILIWALMTLAAGIMAWQQIREGSAKWFGG
jgi:hypothetical protein